MDYWNRQTSWLEIIGTWAITFVLFSVTLFINVILSVVIGAFSGWLLSWTFLGDWIAKGLNAIGVEVKSSELYIIGAAAGFLSGFLKYSFSFKRDGK